MTEATNGGPSGKEPTGHTVSSAHRVVAMVFLTWELLTSIQDSNVTLAHPASFLNFLLAYNT
jgi:hypothetical protein